MFTHWSPLQQRTYSKWRPIAEFFSNNVLLQTCPHLTKTNRTCTMGCMQVTIELPRSVHCPNSIPQYSPIQNERATQEGPWWGGERSRVFQNPPLAGMRVTMVPSHEVSPQGFPDHEWFAGKCAIFFVRIIHKSYPDFGASNDLRYRGFDFPPMNFLLRWRGQFKDGWFWIFSRPLNWTLITSNWSKPHFELLRSAPLNSHCKMYVLPLVFLLRQL